MKEDRIPILQFNNESGEWETKDPLAAKTERIRGTTMIAYKANTVRWTHENGYQTTDNTVIGLLYRNPNKGEPWTIAYEIEEGTGAVKSYMVDKTTVEEVEVKKVTDEMKRIYRYEEDNNDYFKHH